MFFVVKMLCSINIHELKTKFPISKSTIGEWTILFFNKNHLKGKKIQKLKELKCRSRSANWIKSMWIRSGGYLQKFPNLPNDVNEKKHANDFVGKTLKSHSFRSCNILVFCPSLVIKNDNFGEKFNTTNRIFFRCTKIKTKQNVAKTEKENTHHQNK